MKIRNINFGFENGDVVVVDGKYIGYFLIGDVRSYFTRIGRPIEMINIADTFAIEIGEPAQASFSKLLANDIVSIQFTSDSNENYYYWIDYSMVEEDNENSHQYTYLSNLNNLYIVISKDKKLEDFFDKKMINDEDTVNSNFLLYD